MSENNTLDEIHSELMELSEECLQKQRDAEMSDLEAEAMGMADSYHSAAQIVAKHRGNEDERMAADPIEQYADIGQNQEDR